MNLSRQKFSHMGKRTVKTYGNTNVLKHQKIAVFFVASLKIATALESK